MNDVIEALKSYMNYTGLSQRNVAEILGVSEATVSRYLSYERRPNSAVYDRMSHLLGIQTIAENDIHTTKNIIERLIKENAVQSIKKKILISLNGRKESSTVLNRNDKHLFISLK